MMTFMECLKAYTPICKLTKWNLVKIKMNQAQTSEAPLTPILFRLIRLSMKQTQAAAAQESTAHL